MSTTEEVLVKTIKVTTVTTRGEKKTLDFVASGSWKDLKNKLRSEGYATDNMKFVESTKRATLEHDTTIVPDQDFYLFMMPYRNKSGATPKKAVKKAAPKKAAPKKAVAKKVVAKKAAPKKAAPKKAVVPKEKATAIAEVVKSVEQAKIHVVKQDPFDEMKEIARGFNDVKSF